MNITVIGTAFVDIKGHSKNKYIEGGRNPGYIENVYGGVARNIAEDLINAGISSSFVSMADDSATGKALLDGLISKGINTDHVGICPSGCGTWLAVFNELGDVVASISVKADLSGLPALIDEHHEEIFSNTDAIILEINIDEYIVSRVFKYAKMYSLDVYCAVAIMSNALDKKKYLSGAKCFICNAQEAGMLLGHELQGSSADETLQYAISLREKTGCENLVITMAGNGSVYAGANGEHGICPAESVKLVDSTGAGDSYCAGLSAALASGLPLSEACRIGTKMAASVVSGTENVYTGPKLF